MHVRLHPDAVANLGKVMMRHIFGLINLKLHFREKGSRAYAKSYTEGVDRRVEVTYKMETMSPRWTWWFLTLQRFSSTTSHPVPPSGLRKGCKQKQIEAGQQLTFG